MRFAFLLIGLTAIGLGVVHLRRQEMVVRHEIQSLEGQHAPLRRDIWSRQVELSHLETPDALRKRAEQMGLEITTSVPLPIEPVGRPWRESSAE